jgi:hypothetical protein
MEGKTVLTSISELVTMIQHHQAITSQQNTISNRLSALKPVLRILGASSSSDDAEYTRALNALAVKDGPFDQCKSSISAIKWKLLGAKGTGGRGITQQSEEVDEELEKLERFETLALLALEGSSSYVSLNLAHAGAHGIPGNLRRKSRKILRSWILHLQMLALVFSESRGVRKASTSFIFDFHIPYRRPEHRQQTERMESRLDGLLAKVDGASLLPFGLRA